MNMGENKTITLADIERECQRYETQCSGLEEMIGALNADLEKVKRKHLANIKQRAGAIARTEAEITQMIEAAPALFTKPRTAVLHGVKVGFALSKGSLAFDDDDEASVVKLIRAKFKDRIDELLRTKEQVNKDAVKRLPAADLEKIGCRIDGAGDVVVLKRVDGEVEKLVDKMIAKLVEAMVAPNEKEAA